MIIRVEDKIQALKEQTNTYVQEIKKLVEELVIPNKVNLISYFTSSFNISYDSEQESLCLGSYHIRNIGTTPVTNPYLCIQLPKDSPFYFSGRYVHENFTPNLKTQGQSNWERFNDKSSKEEYWLRPVGKSTIEPNETISFTNFQIIWSHNLSYSGTIMGFTYCDQLTEGVVVLNPINLNGISQAQTQEEDNG
ncbi:hypothetical protein [Lysinibacillus sp. ZYM-1]|uniref:hypothetical protein n=1 Tax=Lysinibacillus sp. ZYM-1 TaxID=1681184 RepID=UPI0006CEA45E|nr:hypothetical protein [Lysinibacillus sp. ZYM-1]KPN95890.1 hypothetical protein AO843_02220 [Lysinibacillus sp. ZYM-1]